jgi:hypothetical protein
MWFLDPSVQQINYSLSDRRKKLDYTGMRHKASNGRNIVKGILKTVGERKTRLQTPALWQQIQTQDLRIHIFFNVFRPQLLIRVTPVAIV